MLVISMSDFLGNPAQYVERAQHTSVLIQNEGKRPVTLSVQKQSLFSSVFSVFNSKKRREQRDLRDLEIINANADRFNEEANENLEFQVTD